MPTLTDLYKIHLRQLDLTLAESDLLLQREGGLDGELKTSGSLCEQFIRSTLARYLVPNHFRVTSGYVATASQLKQNNNLPQCDVLIADNSIPPLLRLAESAIEVLPFESLIGAFEAKRTLTKRSLSDALDHIQNIVNSIGQFETLKTDKDLVGANKYVLFHNHSSNKPLIGVIALKSEIPHFLEEATALINEKESLIDFIWTMDGYAIVPAFKTVNGDLWYYTHSARPETKPWHQLNSADFKNAPSDFYKWFPGEPCWAELSPRTCKSRENVFAKMIGITTLTLSRIFPSRMQETQINDYYLSDR